MRRSPRGERGLKSRCKRGQLWQLGRSPRGERGLKLIDKTMDGIQAIVAPLAGSVD